MKIEIIKATEDDIQLIYEMQIISFKPLLDEYQDFDISPGNESMDTIKEEVGNCHLYEKIGYSLNGKSEKIKDNMTIVFYEKTITLKGNLHDKT